MFFLPSARMFILGSPPVLQLHRCDRATKLDIYSENPFRLSDRFLVARVLVGSRPSLHKAGATGYVPWLTRR